MFKQKYTERLNYIKQRVKTKDTEFFQTEKQINTLQQKRYSSLTV